MKNFERVTILATIFTVSALPVSAQNYHYNYGNSRVINQGSVGYVQHESTYIPTGAINNTAKGVITGGVGSKANAMLPGVSWGRTVGTSGDNFYQGGAPDKYKSAVPDYAQTPQRVITVGGRRVSQQQYYQQQQQQQRQQPRGYVYQPGQNGGTPNYGAVDTNVGVQNNGGTASYSSGSGQKNY